MKFELDQNNRGASNEVMLDDLKKVARSLNKDFVTKTEYETAGRFSPATIQKRFGSWSKAHELAGLTKIRSFNTTPEECLASLQKIAEQLGKNTITTTEYLDNGGFSLSILQRHFGSWKKALERAGLSVSSLYHERTTTEQLFENIETLWQYLGHQPKTNDFSYLPSKFSSDTYKRRFGSLRKALEAFVSSLESLPQPSEDTEIEVKLNPTETVIKRHNTSRTISWRLRFMVLRRDNFRCCIDGHSPATHPGTILEVDHIVPWDAGGETVLENLQTLCQRCNSGKSNLSMNNK